MNEYEFFQVGNSILAVTCTMLSAYMTGKILLGHKNKYLAVMSSFVFVCAGSAAVAIASIVHMPRAITLSDWCVIVLQCCHLLSTWKFLRSGESIYGL